MNDLVRQEALLVVEDLAKSMQHLVSLENWRGANVLYGEIRTTTIDTDENDIIDLLDKIAKLLADKDKDACKALIVQARRAMRDHLTQIRSLLESAS